MNALRSRRVFLIASFRDCIAANHAASDYAARFTRGQGFRSYDKPRLFVRLDKSVQGYRVEPNPDFVPSKNPAWLELCEAEAREVNP